MLSFLAPPVPSFPTLPAELFLEIFFYLPPSSKLALSLVNRRLYFILSSRVPKWSQLAPDEKYDFLYLLETLGFCDPSDTKAPYACCTGCQSIHSKFNFTFAELGNCSDKRLCREATKSLWVNPDTQYCYNDLKQHRDASSGWISDDGHLRREGSLTFTITTTYKILCLPKSLQAPPTKIASILDVFNLPTCPHNRLNSPLVLETYSPTAHPVDVSFDAYDSPAKCKFPGCKTRFVWLTRNHASKPDWKTISLEIHRDLGSLSNPADPAWLAQLITPNTHNLSDFWTQRMQWKREMLVHEEGEFAKEQERQQRQPLQHRRASSSMSCLKSSLHSLHHRSKSSLQIDHSNSWAPDSPQEERKPPPPGPTPVDDETELFTPILGPSLATADDEFRRKFKKANRGRLWRDKAFVFVASAIVRALP